MMEARRPAISVVIPTFNAARTLRRALDSVLVQRGVDCEVLVIDGASTDGTARIASEYGTKIRWQSAPDAGIYDAMNRGIRLAAGTWLYFMGADDVLADDEALCRMMAAADPQTEMLCGVVRNHGSRHRLVPEVVVCSFGRGLYWRNTLHQQGTFYRKELFAEMNFDTTLKVLGDYDFHLRLLARGCRYRFVNTVVAVCEARGTSKDFRRALYAEELRIKRRRLPWPVYIVNIPWVWIKYLMKRGLPERPKPQHQSA